MNPAKHEHLNESEYLERERASEQKHEFIHDEMVAMAGGSPLHAMLTANIIQALGRRLGGGPCLVFSSDLRINVAATRLYTYPDVTVVCGPLELHPEDSATVRNPTVIVEVLSESTEAHDRGAKAAHYRHIPSLKEYLLVSQAERQIEHYRRVEEGGWLLTEHTGHVVMPLPALTTELPLDEIYLNFERLNAMPVRDPS